MQLQEIMIIVTELLRSWHFDFELQQMVALCFIHISCQNYAMGTAGSGLNAGRGKRFF